MVGRIERGATRIAVWEGHRAAKSRIAWSQRSVAQTTVNHVVQLSIAKSLWSTAVILRHTEAVVVVIAAIATRRIQADGGGHVAAALKLERSKHTSLMRSR